MPEESPRQDSPSSNERRRFLVIGYKLLALTGLAILAPGIVRLLRLKTDSNQKSSEPSISSNRVPTWHPLCSAFHRDDLLTICMKTGKRTFEQVTLAGNQARLWCLCGGKWSEADLVTELARERGMVEDKAAREVEIFLRPLYEHGFLLAANKDRFLNPQVREIDGSLSAGEIVWQRQLTTN